MNPLDTILDKSEELFFQLGVRSVTMDEISKALGISKKTLYLSVENKKDLVNKVIFRHIEREKTFFDQLKKQNLNAIDTLVELVKHVVDFFQKMPTAVIYDLQKYYPNAWQIIDTFKRSFALKEMEQLILKGQKESLFRAEINAQLTAFYYFIILDSFFQPNFLVQLNTSFNAIYLDYISYHLHGLVSAEGKKYLNTINLNNDK